MKLIATLTIAVGSVKAIETPNDRVVLDVSDFKFEANYECEYTSGELIETLKSLPGVLNSILKVTEPEKSPTEQLRNFANRGQE